MTVFYYCFNLLFILGVSSQDGEIKSRYAKPIEDHNDPVDKVVEDEITKKLADDLLESIEMKFQDDLEKSVNMVLIKVKMLLQNGSNHIQEGLMELQREFEIVRLNNVEETDICVTKMENRTVSIAQTALHHMVLCAYALIGHNPTQAILKVMQIKKMVKDALKPIYEDKDHVYDLLKTCGHDHESLKKVIKCVISKSPILKTTMMQVTGKMIQGIVELTKLIAHGAMHEACLIEVIKSAEEDAKKAIKNVNSCQNDEELEIDGPNSVDNNVVNVDKNILLNRRKYENNDNDKTNEKRKLRKPKTVLSSDNKQYFNHMY